MSAGPVAALAARVGAGDARAIARAISVVEAGGDDARGLIAALYPHGGETLVVGVTGAPGTGKSTLVDRLIGAARRDGKSVAVLAVDPSSPFSGGAVLGDRVRMQAHAADAGVFIRSMATRGHLGGLARATADAAVVLGAAGRDVIFIETVGVGQDEVDVVAAADVSVVVLVPGTGDELQAIKAGVMEIADVFVVNKADREGAERAVQAVAANLSLTEHTEDDWVPPIVKTEATTGAGVDRLWAEIARFRAWAEGRPAVRRRARGTARLRDLLAEAFLRHADVVIPPPEWERRLDAVASRRSDPYAAAAELLQIALGAPRAVEMEKR